MKLRCTFAAAFFLTLSAAALSAQTAAELERILALPAVNCGDAAWLILSSAGAVPPETSAGGAFSFAADHNWFPKNAAPEAPVTLEGVSLLILQSLNLKGGLMFSLFQNPRYSYRELAYRQVIQGRAYSTQTVSGQRLLRILSRALEYSGDTEAEAVTEVPVPPLQEERERAAEIIRAELEEKHIADTDVRPSSAGITISLNNIRFLPDSMELTDMEKEKLKDITAILNEFPNRKILVGGHTAMAGSAEGRMQISAGRARAVADYLISLGCRTRDEITVRGYGAAQPLGDPATAKGQAVNRRVEITLLDEGKGGNE
jgi:outer membrane protein OmpA-like peptidoglycan-associated protein